MEKNNEPVKGTPQTPPVQPQPQQNFNPLDEPVKDRAYTQSSVNTAGMDMNKPIDEPRFTPPPFQKTQPQPEQKKEPINPEMRGLPKKDTEMAAAQAADMVLAGYSWIHELANKGLQVPEKKLEKLQAEGEINLNALIDYDYGKKIRAGEFFKEYNKQVEGILTVTEEFKADVKPVLTRVFAKRGIGMTDEQYLLYAFGKDGATKMIIFFQQKTQLNYMIESIKQATVSQAPQPKQSAPPPQSPQSSSAHTEPVAEKKEPEIIKPEILEPEEEQYSNVSKDVIKRERK